MYAGLEIAMHMPVATAHDARAGAHLRGACVRQGCAAASSQPYSNGRAVACLDGNRIIVDAMCDRGVLECVWHVLGQVCTAAVWREAIRRALKLKPNWHPTETGCCSWILDHFRCSVSAAGAGIGTGRDRWAALWDALRSRPSDVSLRPPRQPNSLPLLHARESSTLHIRLAICPSGSNSG
ncbi:hypothetical protein IQ07DRAFT_605438 [Pyrenochaeta sp. DS3sAY3a]|nr:hypothetical protein IQ07DRAFT_605438 [Pyrenochaeta sp. DS3sAY3a]